MEIFRFARKRLISGCMARPERFELPTYCSGGNRSIQLSYGRAPTIQFTSWAQHQQSVGSLSSCARLDFKKELREKVETRLPASAAATTASTALATAATAAGSALRFGTRFVYVQRAASHLRAIQSSNRLIALFGVSHFYKTETTRAACISVGHDADAIHLTMSFE